MRPHAPTAGLMTLIILTLPGTALPAAMPWAQTLTQQALSSGFLTRLPPTVSVAFGLPKAAEGTDVRQLLTKDGPRIRTFNVGVANHGDLVMFNVDAHSGANVAYLLTPAGELRKAVSYKAGGEAQPLSAADAKSGFAREQHFWSARARKAASTGAAAPATPAAPAAPAAPATPPKP
jgi:hypothetical protein